MLCNACREASAAGGLLSHVTDYMPKKVTSYLQIPCTLPVGSACSLAQRYRFRISNDFSAHLPSLVLLYKFEINACSRLVEWIPDVPRDMSWFYGMVGDIYKQVLKEDEKYIER